MKLPSFESLPIIDGLPSGCAWGVFDNGNVDGGKDRLGKLNLLTSEVVNEAKNEIKEGISVSLDLPLNFFNTPAFKRKPFERKVFSNNTEKKISCDEELHINTQSCSQWDGHSHFGYKERNLFYNGVTLENILKSENPGIDHWSKNGGIVGRGVFLDYVKYAEHHSIEYTAVGQSHEITTEQLEEIAKEQSVEFKPGDILLIRTGVTQWYQQALIQGTTDEFLQEKYVGLKAGIKTAKWFWDNQFSAVAGDTATVESWPPKQFDEHSLHFYLLAMQGMPLGELWNLEQLSETCEKLGKYSFFLTSAPLNIPHGIASPSNAIAIF